LLREHFVEDPAERGDDRVAGRAVADRGLDPIDDRSVRLEEDVLFALEVPEKGRHRDLRPFGDQLDRRSLVAAFPEQLERRGGQSLARLPLLALAQAGRVVALGQDWLDRILPKMHLEVDEQIELEEELVPVG
jgi:hypothetical protein